MPAAKSFSRKKKTIQQVPRGRIYIQSSFNNTMISITDALGNLIAWSSAGATGFKGARKSTPYAAQIAMRQALDKVQNNGLQSVDIFISGVGSGRESAIRILKGANITVTSIKDITPIPHNGCRAKKPRRV